MEENTKKKIKLIATDLDGTLLYPKRYFSLFTKKNKKFLRAFLDKDKNNEVVVITGRNNRLKKRIEKKIKHPVTYIACNGGICFDKENNIISSRPIDKEICKQIVNHYKDVLPNNVYVVFPNNNKMYCFSKISRFINGLISLGSSMRFSYSERLVIRNKDFFKAVETQPVYKLMLVFGITSKHNSAVPSSLEIIQKEFGHIVTASQSHQSIEITSKDTNKANALLEYIQSKGIDKDEVIVIGDSGNDVGMFENFVNSFCMANAPKEVRDKAKYIVNSVSDIQKYIDFETMTIKSK